MPDDNLMYLKAIMITLSIFFGFIGILMVAGIIGGIAVWLLGIY